MTMTATATRLETWRGNGQSGVVDRLPPHSIEAEEATIGSCLIDPTAIERVAPIFRDESKPFYIIKNQWVWDAIVTLWQRGEPVDFVTITRELRARGQIEEIGGPAYIQQLIDAVPTAIHAEGYARIVAEHATRRRLLDAASYLAAAAFDEGELQAITLDRARHSLDVLRRSREIGAAQRDRFRIFSADDALAEQPPIEWLINELFSIGSVSLLVGAAKKKKTWIALHMAVSLAMGAGHWLTLNAVQCPVLIIDEESGRRRMLRRLYKVMHGLGAQEGLPLFFTSLAGLNLLDPDDVQKLREAVQQSGARFVVIDALIDTLRSNKSEVENSSVATQAALHALREIAEELGCAFLVIHHEGKSGMYRGSSALEGGVDLLLTIKGERESDHIEFDLEATRDVKPFQFAAEISFADGLLHLTPATSTKQEHFTKSEQGVLIYMRMNDTRLTLAEIGRGVESTGVVKHKTAENAALNLAKPDRDYLHRILDGGVFYELTQKGREVSL